MAQISARECKIRGTAYEAQVVESYESFISNG